MVLQNVCVLCVFCAGRAYTRRGMTGAVADVRPESAHSAADVSASVTELHEEQQLSAQASGCSRGPCPPVFPACPHHDPTRALVSMTLQPEAFPPGEEGVRKPGLPRLGAACFRAEAWCPRLPWGPGRCWLDRRTELGPSLIFVTREAALLPINHTQDSSPGMWALISSPPLITTDN